MSLTRLLSEFCTKLRYDDLAPEVIEKAKICILDTIGVGLKGRSRTRPS